MLWMSIAGDGVCIGRRALIGEKRKAMMMEERTPYVSIGLEVKARQWWWWSMTIDDEFADLAKSRTHQVEYDIEPNVVSR